LAASLKRCPDTNLFPNLHHCRRNVFDFDTLTY
jgi:hypothetical protein